MTLLHSIGLLLLFLPGVSFRRAYLSNPYSYKHKFTNVVNEIIVSFLISVILHFTFIWIGCLLNWKIFLEAKECFQGLLIPFSNKGIIASALYEGLYWSADHFFAYIFILSISSYLIGVISWMIIKASRLDLICKFLRFNNAYFYAFTTRMPYKEWKNKIIEGLNSSINNSHENESQNEETRDPALLLLNHIKNSRLERIKLWYKDNLIRTRLDLLIQLEGKEVIYKGELYNPDKTSLIYNREGIPESIILKNVSKQDFSCTANSSKSETNSTKIQGKELVFKIDSIINYNIRYILTIPYTLPQPTETTE